MKYCLLGLFLFLGISSYADDQDSTQIQSQFSADIIVSTNGISRIPSLSLMKPAA